MIEFAHPYAFLLLLVTPALWWSWLRKSRRPVVRFSDVTPLTAVGGRTRLLWLTPTLRTAGFVALVVALARPQQVDVSKQIYAEGVAIMMAVDTSSSMTADDLTPRGARPVSRLDVVKDVFERFVDGDGGELPGRPNDLIGMVRFARYADSACPLTLDRQHLLRILDKTDIVATRDEDGTAIGDGLALAVERLKDLKRTSGAGEQHVIKSRVVVLLTDGENNSGAISPETAGELAATYDIKVYAILAGRGQATPFGFIPVDDNALRYIADTTGGKFYRADTQDALEKIYADIDQLERTKVEEKHYLSRDERSQPWLLTAFACIGLQTVLSATRLRKIP